MPSAAVYDETAEFLARVDASGNGDSPSTPDPAEPQVVFQGALVLSREQEDGLVDFAFARMKELEDSLGRDRANMDQGAYGRVASLSDLDTFFGRRRLFDLVYHKRVEWRRTAMPGIFSESNLHLPMVRRIVQQQISRASNYFFSTDPWFATTPQGAADEMAAQRINRYAQWKFREAKVRATMERAVEKAFIRGEAVVKTTNVRDSRFYEDFLTVAIDPETGEPLMAADGDYIQDTDTWTAAVVLNPETGAEEIELDPETDAPVMVLGRDPRTQKPPGDLVFEARKLLRERVNYAGPDAQVVYYLDFLCPEDAESIQKADLVAHYYDVPAVTLAQAYMNRAGDPDDAERPRILDLLREASGIRTEETAMASGLRAEDGERRDVRHADTGSMEGMVAVAEVWLRRDVNGDGRQEDIVLFVDRTTRKPIFYDYSDRVTPKGQRPFHAVRVNPVDGRWYGGSQVDLFWDLQMFIDLTMNRWNFSQSAAGRIDFWNPAAVYEGDADPHLRMNHGKSYRLKPGFSADDALTTKYLNDVKGADLQRQIEYFQQVATTMSGVTTANDAAMAGLDTAKLATSVRNIEKGGQELFAPLLSHLEEGLSAASRDLLYLLAAGMDEAEVFTFFEGDVRRVDEIKPAEIRGLDFVVEMELTRYHHEQQLQQRLAALDVIDRFYAEPPEKQMLVAPLYRQTLKLFEIKHADQLIQPGILFPPAGAGMIDPAQAAEATASKPTGKSEPNL